MRIMLMTKVIKWDYLAERFNGEQEFSVASDKTFRETTLKRNEQKPYHFISFNWLKMLDIFYRKKDVHSIQFNQIWQGVKEIYI